MTTTTTLTKHCLLLIAAATASNEEEEADHAHADYNNGACDIDTLRRAPIGDTPEAARDADEALCALECAIYHRPTPHHQNQEEGEDDRKVLLRAGGDALRGHIMARALEALAQKPRGVHTALAWLCASGLEQPETRRLLARRALNARKDTEMIRAGLREHEALAWERQRVVLEAALRGGHHARADAMLWHVLVRSPVVLRDAEAAERLRETVASYASETQRQALDVFLASKKRTA